VLYTYFLKGDALKGEWQEGLLALVSLICSGPCEYNDILHDVVNLPSGERSYVAAARVAAGRYIPRELSVSFGNAARGDFPLAKAKPSGERSSHSFCG
jgi:hypothetical protein